MCARCYVEKGSGFEVFVGMARGEGSDGAISIVWELFLLIDFRLYI